MNNQTQQRGESYIEILQYFGPEFISSAALYAFPFLIDAFIVAQLGSTSTYGVLGIANNFLHMLTKLAEAFSIATLTIVGTHNGAKEYKKAGETLGNSFWTTIFVGLIAFAIIFTFNQEIYALLNVPPKMAIIGAPFLKLRGIGVFLSFVYLGFFGFLKGIKNTKTPMKIFVIGIIIFLIFDYALVLGRFGFPQMRLIGSAIATIIQYSIMIVLCIIHILKTKEYRPYFASAFFYLFDKKGIVKIVSLSVPILIDKMSISYAYVHLSSLMNRMGKNIIASFAVIKDLERFAFLPAVALATIITFLVSNRLGSGDPVGARANIRKVLKMGGIMVFGSLAIICINPTYFASLFDAKNKFAIFAGSVFPIISVFVIFDFIQLILSGVMRGSGDVKALMIIRFVVCFLFFYPLSTWIANIDMADQGVKFVLLYGSFYVSTGLIGLLCIARIKYRKWDNL